MQSLAQIYHPITAAPFRHDPTYCEIPPCDALKPYIRCFWGTMGTVDNISTLDNRVIIPDTCMDIIFTLDYSRGAVESAFCGIDEHSHFSSDTYGKIGTATFGIRFYPWSAVLFADEDMRNVKNKSFDAGEHFDGIKRQLEPRLWAADSLEERAKIAEEVLIKCISKHADSTFLNAVHFILSTNGCSKTSELCLHTAVSEKQLERVFSNNVGISPKAFSSLIRYQLLWQDMLFCSDFNALDAVEKFGYCDQSHLLRDFKRRHLMTPQEAVKFARQNR